MGVPAFFKWLSTKYPKIVVDCNEERHTWDEDGNKIPVDTSKPNPNGLEYEYAAALSRQSALTSHAAALLFAHSHARSTLHPITLSATSS